VPNSKRLAEDEFRFVQRDWKLVPSMFVVGRCLRPDLGRRCPPEVLDRLLAPYASRNVMLGNVYTYARVFYAIAGWRRARRPTRGGAFRCGAGGEIEESERRNAGSQAGELARVSWREARRTTIGVQDSSPAARQTAEALDRFAYEESGASLRLPRGAKQGRRARLPNPVEEAAAPKPDLHPELRAWRQKQTRPDRSVGCQRYWPPTCVGYSGSAHTMKETTPRTFDGGTSRMLSSRQSRSTAVGVVKNNGGRTSGGVSSAVERLRLCYSPPPPPLVPDPIKMKLTVAETEDRRIALSESRHQYRRHNW